MDEIIVYLERAEQIGTEILQTHIDAAVNMRVTEMQENVQHALHNARRPYLEVAKEIAQAAT